MAAIMHILAYLALYLQWFYKKLTRFVFVNRFPKDL